MLKWFWTYFPGFTRSISRLVHPNKSTSGHGPMNRLWAEAKETFKQMNSLLMWIGGVQVPNCLTSKKVLKDLKSVKRTRTVLTCCTKNASAIETSKLGRESHIFQIMHSHKVMAKIARWYNEVAPLNCLIRSPFHHSADIPFFFALQPLQQCLSVSVTLGISFNKWKSDVKKCPWISQILLLDQSSSMILKGTSYFTT